MSLSSQQKERIARYIPAFRRYLDDADTDPNILEQRSRLELFAQLLSPAGLRAMGELEFGQVIGSLWASRLWGDKGYLVGKLIRDNGLPALITALKTLLWGKGALSERYDAFRKLVRGMGTASITEILMFVHPDSCGLWNDTTRQALDILGFRDDLPFLRKAQINGTDYATFNETLGELRDQLAAHGIDDQNFLGVNYFLFTVWEVGRENIPPPPTAPVIKGASEDFDHDDVVDTLVNIGRWLGFEAEKEKLVARGAKVDLIWQARIANLGVVTYVFEVQRRGSIDSLILNLQRAQNNPTVQRLIVVAASEPIERIRQEIASLPESFRKSVSFMEVRHALRAAELIGELAGIIGALELVRSEFGV